MLTAGLTLGIEPGRRKANCESAAFLCPPSVCTELACTSVAMELAVLGSEVDRSEAKTERDTRLSVRSHQYGEKAMAAGSLTGHDGNWQRWEEAPLGHMADQ